MTGAAPNGSGFPFLRPTVSLVQAREAPAAEAEGADTSLLPESPFHPGKSALPAAVEAEVAGEAAEAEAEVAPRSWTSPLLGASVNANHPERR